MVDPVLMSGLLDESHHPSDSSHGVGLKPERERQEEHRLRVGRALDRGKERVVDGQHEVPLHARKLANEPVVHPQPAPVAERVRVRLLIAVPVDARMCAKKSGEEMPAASSRRLRSFQAGCVLR
jgi:hypothetical protein